MCLFTSVKSVIGRMLSVNVSAANLLERDLADRVAEGLARHALAEEEARKLSKFNAEIVGHNNPAQRIVYVDRIRRELHETKQVR